MRNSVETIVCFVRFFTLRIENSLVGNVVISMIFFPGILQLSSFNRNKQWLNLLKKNIIKDASFQIKNTPREERFNFSSTLIDGGSSGKSPASTLILPEYGYSTSQLMHELLINLVH